MAQESSKGQCLYCEKSYTKRGISSHMDGHLSKKANGNSKGKSYLVEVKPNPRYWDQNPYFLSLWVDGRTDMGELDDYLRAIWLECCGHMSEFSDPSKEKNEMDWGMDGYVSFLEKIVQGRVSQDELLRGPDLGEISWEQKAKQVLSEGLKLDYKYDFGDTTPLQLSVIREYACKADESIVLLSRNEIPFFPCVKCKTNPSVVILNDGVEHALLCKSCYEKELEEDSSIGDEGFLPVVNSPRMGVCAYTGGMIDKERDLYQGVEYVVS